MLFKCGASGEGGGKALLAGSIITFRGVKEEAYCFCGIAQVNKYASTI